MVSFGWTPSMHRALLLCGAVFRSPYTRYTLIQHFLENKQLILLHLWKRERLIEMGDRRHTHRRSYIHFMNAFNSVALILYRFFFLSYFISFHFISSCYDSSCIHSYTESVKCTHTHIVLNKLHFGGRTRSKLTQQLLFSFVSFAV